jgi:hypothetical protein
MQLRVRLVKDADQPEARLALGHRGGLHLFEIDRLGIAGLDQRELAAQRIDVVRLRAVLHADVDHARLLRDRDLQVALLVGRVLHRVLEELRCRHRNLFGALLVGEADHEEARHELTHAADVRPPRPEPQLDVVR